MAGLRMAGPGMGVQSSGGVGRWLTPGPTGRRADGRCRAGTGRRFPRWAIPVETALPRSPRTLEAFPRGLPVGVGRWASRSRWATPYSVLGACGAVDQAKRWVTTAAVTGSSRRRRGSRGHSGANRYPEGGTVQGKRRPLRLGAWRPRRSRSAMRGRAYAATAPRIGRRS
jgi:hypothetical protein